MSKASELKSAGAAALRAAGFLPLPRWWVKKGEDLDLIEFIVRKHSAEVAAIRERVIWENAQARKRQREIEEAWAAQKKKDAKK